MIRLIVWWAVASSSPFEKNHPKVAEAEAAYEQGDYEKALSLFDEAAAELPQDATVAYDRGTTLHKLGRHDEARAAFQKASELNRGKEPLESKIHYNLGNSWAATQQQKEAISEYRRALRSNPDFQDARHNLEVMLKNVPPPQKSPDGGTLDGGNPDAGSDGGSSDAGRPDGGSPDGGRGDGGSDGGSKSGGDAGTSDAGSKSDGGSGSPKPDRGDGGQDAGAQPLDAGLEEAARAQQSDGGSDVSKQEAEKMLDALKATERNLQLWKFKPDKNKNKKRDAHEKDW